MQEVNPLLNILYEFEARVGPLIPYEGPDEDTPIFFKNENFLAHLNEIAQEQSQQQYFDYFIMRIRSLFTDKRIASVISTENCDEVTLLQWLNDYIGQDYNKPSISIIDLSLLPSEVLYTITSVMARIVFEAHHRYKKLNDTVLPTVLVVEEAHNFIKNMKLLMMLHHSNYVHKYLRKLLKKVANLDLVWFYPLNVPPNFLQRFYRNATLFCYTVSVMIRIRNWFTNWYQITCVGCYVNCHRYPRNMLFY